MSETNGSSYHNDPLYLEALAYFQKGEWEQGHSALNQLIKNYPLEPELRSFRMEMQLRAYISTYENEDKKHTRWARFKRSAVRLAVVAILVFIILWGFSAYSSFVSQQVNTARAQVEEEVRLLNLKAKSDSIQQYLASFRAEEALAIIDEISQVSPDYPGLAEARQSAEKIQELNQDYERAMKLKAEGDLVSALAILETIPSYRDVALQVREIQRSVDLSDLVQQGDDALLAGDWLTAIEKYEDVRNRDSLFQREDMESRLYNSYINAAKGILDEQPDSLEALQEAREYFGKALKLKPQDPKIAEEMQEARESVALRLFNKYIDLAQQSLVDQADSLSALTKADEYFALAAQIYPNDETLALQRKLAQSFIQAQVDFQNEKWDASIKNLAYIFESDAEYAGGTTIQMLYDAYIARGDKFLLNGRPQSAYEDFTNALSVAQVRPDSPLRLFEAQIRMGDALGQIGNYELAIYQYRSALDAFNLLETSILSPELDKALKDADNYFLRKRFKQAYTLYNQAMQDVIKGLQTVEHVVTAEDYLSKLANYYQTTVGAILKANNKNDPSDFSIGDKIIIPVAP